jgi:Immunoglobulin domain
MKARINLLMSAALMAAAASSFGQPTITTQPQDKLAIPGQTITLTVAVSGIAPLTYQWQREDSPLPGKTNTSLSFTNIQVVDAGDYSVLVTNSSGSTNSRVAAVAVIGPVALDPKLSSNIRLGDDPPQLPLDRRAQAGPHIARSFVNPALLVATFQEGRYENGGAATCGYSVSTNGGLTWSRALIPGLTTINGGTWSRALDPVAAIDLQGNIFLINLLTAAGGSRAVSISASTNQGQFVSQPHLVFSSATPQLDWNWLAVDTFPEAPAANRIAVTFSILDDVTDRIHSTLSDNGGANWSPSVPASPVKCYGSQPFFLPDGKLAVVYFRYLNTLFDLDDQAQIEMVLSQDGGATFGLPQVVTTKTRPAYHDLIARDAWDLPFACTDRQAGVIYVTYQVLAGLATNRPSIMFTRSIDKGVTWSTPVAVNDTPTNQGVFNPAIAVSPDGQHVTIEFYDKRNQTTNSANNLVDLYLAESFDGGDTWQPNIRLSDVSSDLRLAPLTGDGRMLGDYQGIVPALNSNAPGVAVWIDTRNGNPDPYVVRINRTKGTTFEIWRKLRFSTNDLANVAISGENADPEGDGIPNLAEYAFGFEPTRVDTGPLKITRAAPGTNATVIVSYERLAVLSDIQFSWQASSDLTGWAPATPDQEAIGPGRDPSMQRVTVSFPAVDQARFFRLGMANVPPPP